MWSRDSIFDIDNSYTLGKNSFGIYPFILGQQGFVMNQRVDLGKKTWTKSKCRGSCNDCSVVTDPRVGVFQEAYDVYKEAKWKKR